MKERFGALVLALALVGAACGGDDGDGGGGGGEDGGLGVERVELAIDNDDFMNQIAWMIADEQYWPDLGFTQPADVVATDEYLAGLIGGSVWVAQGETDAIWAAMAEGSVDLVAIGVEKSGEVWELGVGPGIEGPEDLAGAKISGGTPGDRNVSIGEQILDELGVGRDNVEWVSIEGGSDERLVALLAGQIDAAVLQPRHIAELEAAGGQILYYEVMEAPQEMWVVERGFLEENEEAVCAYLEGRIAAKQWASEGGPPDFDVNKEEAIQLGRDRGLDPSQGDIDEWATEMTTNWSLDGGASVESFDKFESDFKALGTIPEDFAWRDHTDFTCLWQAQENLGIEQNPVEGDV
jgi:ABC-type nitrate/sulfonate/bicarbonate transport system substrate-binding protein